MAFEELKRKQRVLWGAGAFERIEPNLGDMHRAVVERLEVQPGERFLDVGCGTGGAAFLAAEASADVTGLDLSPVLIETAKERAAARGLPLRLDVGDAEDLPYDDGSFDVVCSTAGVMFAPDQETAALELARVCRSGGRLGVASWRPEETGLFKVMAPFQAPPPPGLPSPLDWGREEVVERLLGAAFDLELGELDAPLEGPSREAVWETFSTSFGPLTTLLESLDSGRAEELHRSFLSWLEPYQAEDGSIHQPRPYLLALGARR